MNLFRPALILLFVLPFTFLQAQTADEIVNKHITAIGGKETISKIKSQVVYAELSVMGISFPSTTTILFGKGLKNVSNLDSIGLPGQEIIQCITPTGGWMFNPLAGDTEPKPLPDDQVKEAQASLDPGSAFFNYKAKGSKVELMGREKVEGVNAYKIKLENKNGQVTFYFIHPSTYYVIKQESTSILNGENATSISTFSNYKKTGIGFVMPFTTTTTNQGTEITINVKKVEYNKTIDPKIFEMPK